MKVLALAVSVFVGCMSLRLLALELPKEVREIDEYVADLEVGIPRMGKRDINIVTGTDGGGALSAFFIAKSLQKSELRIGLSNRNIENTFYYRDGKIILIVHRELFSKSDRKTGVSDPARLEGGLEEKYYFNADQQVQFLISFRDGPALKREAAQSERAAYLLRLSHVTALSAGSKDAVVDLESLLKAQ